MLSSSPFVLLMLIINNGVMGIPQLHLEKRSLDNLQHVDTQTIIKHTAKVIPVVPIHSVIIEPINARKKKGPNLPTSISIPHQLIVPNLHVIPISNVHRIHTVNHIVKNDMSSLITHTVSHSTNITHPTQLIPVLIPNYNHLVPVHDLTVIPLHSARKDMKISFKVSENNGREESINNYRNPLGGYGAGWFYGGHGAGHGFHYAYG